MGKLTKIDKKGHEDFKNDKELYRTYSNYYKREVTLDTSVKIIHFKLVKDF